MHTELILMPDHPLVQSLNESLTQYITHGANHALSQEDRDQIEKTFIETSQKWVAFLDSLEKKQFCNRVGRECVYYYPDDRKTVNEGNQDTVLRLDENLGITIHPGQSYCWWTGKVFNADGTEDTNGQEV